MYHDSDNLDTAFDAGGKVSIGIRHILLYNINNLLDYILKFSKDSRPLPLCPSGPGLPPFSSHPPWLARYRDGHNPS